VAPLRLTYPTVLVLDAVAHGCAYGFDIIDATGLGSGTVYPVLRRLERAGLLRGTPEPVREAAGSGRPRRRYYSITGAGAKTLKAALERHPAAAAVFGAALRPRPA
jgi:PadR family transcriptional regulator, regulatory protein PadR